MKSQNATLAKIIADFPGRASIARVCDTRPRYKLRKLSVTVLLLCGLLAGNCSRVVVRTAYRQADTLLYYRLDRVFAFDDQQEQWVRRQIQAHYRWHRTTQLPAYSAFLRDLRGRVQRGLQEADLDWAQQQMTGFRNALMIRIYPDARLLLLGLGDRQLQDLPDRLADYNEELAQKAALSPEERTERSAKETVESVEEWLGSLQQDQKGELGQIARAMPDETPLRLQMNRERQAQLLAALQSPERGARTDALLRAWLLHAEASRPNYYRLAVLRWRRSFKDLALKIDQMMTAEQRQYFSARLGEWIEDLEQLSRG